MTRHNPNPEQSATWAYNIASMQRTLNIFLDSQQSWKQIDLRHSNFQREMTCLSLDPSDVSFWRNSLDRGFLFHNLVGKLFHLGAQRGLLPGLITRDELCELIEVEPLSPELEFYLVIERTNGGWKSFLDLIVEKLDLISETIVDDGRSLCLPGDTSEICDISTIEFGVLCGLPEISDGYFTPGDGLIFLYSSAPLTFGNRKKPLKVNRGLVESDVMPSIAKHFLATGEPPRDTLHIDLATHDVTEKIVDPRFFEDSIHLVLSALDNAEAASQNKPARLSSGPWCQICRHKDSCISSQMFFDDGEPS